MKKLFLNRIFCALLCLALCLSCLALSGCSEEDFTLYFGVDTLPQTLDPQRASSYSEILVARNCFMGLMWLDEDCEPVLVVADDYNISNDELTYTFFLDNVKWSNGKKITADDFVYAVERACTPSTKTSNTEVLINIKGAKEILSGNDAELGVYSDGDDVVVFELLTPDSNFLYKLTLPVFMPCNKEFFEKCKGKYGLGTDYILTNGNFKPVSWSTKGGFVRLNRTTDDNKKLSEVKSVYISMGTSGKDTITRINDAEIGMTLSHSGDYTKVNTSKYTIETTFNKNYVIVINKNSAIGSIEAMTEAFAESVDREYVSSRLGTRFKSTLSVLPEISVLNGNLIDVAGTASNHKYKFSPQNARNKFLQALNETSTGKFPNTKVLCLDGAEIKSTLTDVVTKWQSNLGAYVNIETFSSEETLIDTIKNGDYTIAFIPVSNNVLETLNLFTTDGAADIKSPDYNEIIEKLKTTYDSENGKELLGKALEILSNEPSVIPIMTTPSAAVWNIEYENVIFNKTDLTVDFSIIHK